MPEDDYGTWSPGRVEELSDGVIAIAITLLVLEIGIPTIEETSSDHELWSRLRDLWPSYVGFLISFITIALFWMIHHRLFHRLNRVNHQLIVANMALLIVVVFLPFPTAVLAEHLNHDGERAATIFYSGCLLVGVMIFSFLWHVAKDENGHLLKESVSRVEIAILDRRIRRSVVLYGVAFALSFLIPLLCLALLAALCVYYLLAPHALPKTQ